VRASDLIRQAAYDRAGRQLGIVVDLVTEPDPAGIPVVVAVIVNPHWHGRLLGQVRSEAHGPWLLDRFTRLLSRGMRTVAWNEIWIGDPPDSPDGDGPPPVPDADRGG
jgi:hypothetical protein